MVRNLHGVPASITGHLHHAGPQRNNIPNRNHILIASATSKNEVSLSTSSKTWHRNRQYLTPGPWYGCYQYGDDRPILTFLENLPRFARRVRHFNIQSYNAMINQVYTIFLHCIKIEELVAKVYFDRATDAFAATSLRMIQKYTQTKDEWLAFMYATHGVAYDEVPFFGTYRYTTMRNIPEFCRYGDHYYDYRSGYLVRAFNIYSSTSRSRSASVRYGETNSSDVPHSITLYS